MLPRRSERSTKGQLPERFRQSDKPTAMADDQRRTAAPTAKRHRREYTSDEEPDLEGFPSQPPTQAAPMLPALASAGTSYAPPPLLPPPPSAMSTGVDPTLVLVQQLCRMNEDMMSLHRSAHEQYAARMEMDRQWYEEQKRERRSLGGSATAEVQALQKLAREQAATIAAMAMEIEVLKASRNEPQRTPTPHDPRPPLQRPLFTPHRCHNAHHQSHHVAACRSLRCHKRARRP